jgi:hypothetical protein
VGRFAYLEYKTGGFQNYPFKLYLKIGSLLIMIGAMSWFMFSGNNAARPPQKDTIREASVKFMDTSKHVPISKPKEPTHDIFLKNREENEKAKENFLKLPQVK